MYVLIIRSIVVRVVVLSTSCGNSITEAITVGPLISGQKQLHAFHPTMEFF